MDGERRKGDAPIPDNLEEVLNEPQRRALPGIVQAGWELRFLRRPLFQEPVLLLHNHSNNRTGILDREGKINIRAGIKVRYQENQTRTIQSDEPLVWTK